MSFGGRSARSAWPEVACDGPGSEASTTGLSIEVARFSTTLRSQSRFNVVGGIFWQGTDCHKHFDLEARGLHGLFVLLLVVRNSTTMPMLRSPELSLSCSRCKLHTLEPSAPANMDADGDRAKCHPWAEREKGQVRPPKRKSTYIILQS